MKAKQPAKSPAVFFGKLEQELVRVEALRNQLWAELEERAETITERTGRGMPIKRLLSQHDRLRERYCVVENRRQKLLAMTPSQSAVAAEF